jgi:hypothetical protein
LMTINLLYVYRCSLYLNKAFSRRPCGGLGQKEDVNGASRFDTDGAEETDRQ